MPFWLRYKALFIGASRKSIGNILNHQMAIRYPRTMGGNNEPKARKKMQEALLRKGRTVYEFVGHNDVLPLIKQGRDYLASMK